MLVELNIKEFAIIKNLSINFNEGLNILTGETGAGKSIIIDAIQLIIGGRSSVEFIRTNAQKAEIEALFHIPDNHPVYETLSIIGIGNIEEGTLLIKRELLLTGKSICRINGQLVSLTMLKEVGKWLIQLYSQLQHQQLLSQDNQLALLDAYGEDELLNLKNNYSEKYTRYIALKKELEILSKNERETAQRIDLLQYQIKEISEANLTINEDIELEQLRNKIKHSEKIVSGLNNAYNILSDESGVINLIGNANGILAELAEFDENIKNIYEQISSIYYQIDDLSLQIGRDKESIDFDVNQLNSIEERLSVIHLLKRKYGSTIEEVLSYLNEIETELDMIQNKDRHIQEVQTDLVNLTNEVFVEATEISNIRKKYAQELSNLIESELKDLHMSKTKLKIDINFQEDMNGIMYEGKNYNITKSGLDKVTFLITPNPGEPLKPLNKIVSGGELSRIMLAILTILAHRDKIPTVIFDEIDTGVSGRAAQAIAEKLASVSRNKQVFVITHLPQVASIADYHYLIEKNIINNNTNTQISLLDEQKRSEVLALMLGGLEITNKTIEHAKEMINNSNYFKKNLLK